MYTQYWDLNLLPFENVPNPPFFYPSPMHEEALERLTYSVFQGKGGAMVTGGVGCGKTMLSRVLMDRLNIQRCQAVSMTNPALGPRAFVEMVLDLFQIPFDHSLSKASMWRALERQLRNSLKHNRASVLLIDEAHVIDDKRTLEELRMLLNLQTEDKFLLHVILLGQLELEAKIAQVEPLHQRIAVRYRLEPLSTSETLKYIEHRLAVAGCDKAPFTLEAKKTIFTYTKGIPREINNLCDRSLLASYIAEQEMINEEMVNSAWRDLSYQTQQLCLDGTMPAG